jgi:hypothetical protein
MSEKMKKMKRRKKSMKRRRKKKPSHTITKGPQTLGIIIANVHSML